MKADEVTKTLRKCQLFSDLSDKELGSIAKLGSIEEYKAGDIIYEQGNLGTKLYILSEGKVSLYRNFDLGDTRTASTTVYVSRERPQRRLLGGWCTLVGDQHIQMCSARCDKPTKVIAIGCSDLKKVMSKNSKIRIKILEKLVLILRDRIESSYVAMETL